MKYSLFVAYSNFSSLFLYSVWIRSMSFVFPSGITCLHAYALALIILFFPIYASLFNFAPWTKATLIELCLSLFEKWLLFPVVNHVLSVFLYQAKKKQTKFQLIEYEIFKFFSVRYLVFFLFYISDDSKKKRNKNCFWAKHKEDPLGWYSTQKKERGKSFLTKKEKKRRHT